MIARPSLKTGFVPTAAAGSLLFALAGASLGCVWAACFGVDDAAPLSEALAAPAPVPNAVPLALPVAGMDAVGRCSGARSRRAPCRSTELPAA